MNGAIVVHKPAGPTSHDVVARVRRAVGERRIGHTGTLDPLATGVLPLLVGRATRLAQFLTADEKTYVAGIRLGAATATYDAEPRLVRDAHGAPIALEPLADVVTITRNEIEGALGTYIGTFEQTPPPYSAKKVRGTPAYRLARRHEPVAIRPVRVAVKSLRLLQYEGGLATVEVECSSGFYVRSLAHDVGIRLGCGGHLESLHRVRSGPFTVTAAVPLARIEEQPESIAQHVIPMRDVLAGLPQVVVSEQGARRVSHGQPISAADLQGDVRVDGDTRHVRVLDRTGDLLAVAERSPGGTLQPVVVLV